MGKYYFVESEIEGEYRYVFLCGSKYRNGEKQDKRNVLSAYLSKCNSLFKPIILEKNFIFKRESSKYLSYDDVYMSNLYQVELLVSYFADVIFIIHESISTAAEAGLFFGNLVARKKTCLLVPDMMAVEEDKVGAFMDLAFFKDADKDSHVQKIRYYPRVKRYVLSENVRRMHTFFYHDEIGTYLGNKICHYLSSNCANSFIKFTRDSEKIKNGYIHYRVRNAGLTIRALPKQLLVCMAACFNIPTLEHELFSKSERPLQELVALIVNYLKETFRNTVMELTGKDIREGECSIQPELDIKKLYISSVIGMGIYIFQAAGFLAIEKSADYLKTGNVRLVRHMVDDGTGAGNFFYRKYAQCVRPIVDKRI